MESIFVGPGHNPSCTTLYRTQSTSTQGGNFVGTFENEEAQRIVCAVREEGLTVDEAHKREQALAFDLHGQRIAVGDRILFPLKSGGAGGGASLNWGGVLTIDPASHRGAGYWTRPLRIRREADGVRMKLLYPGNVLVVDPLPGVVPEDVDDLLDA